MYTNISIHKALAGLDEPQRPLVCTGYHFNPQGPCGPRPFAASSISTRGSFQSTRPLRASTYLTFGKDVIPNISIHKALAGLDKGLHRSR